MQPEIRTITEKKLIGTHLSMSMVNNRTGELWKRFMPRRHEIKDRVGTDLISMQVFDPDFDFRNFNPAASFEKWAVAEVSSFDQAPEGMDTFILPGGQYAVFVHKGPASEGERTFRHIFGTWLPGSDYLLDPRPHFELLGEKYKNDSPDSEEEIWIPVRKKQI